MTQWSLECCNFELLLAFRCAPGYRMVVSFNWLIKTPFACGPCSCLHSQTHTHIYIHIYIYIYIYTYTYTHLSDSVALDAHEIIP